MFIGHDRHINDDRHVDDDAKKLVIIQINFSNFL